MLTVCQTGYEGKLAAELRDRGFATGGVGPGWVAAAGPKDAVPESAFAHLFLLDPVEIRGGSVNALAQEAWKAFGESLRGERIEREWPNVWLGASESVGLGRRVAAVQAAFDQLLKSRLSRLAKLSRPELPAGIGPARGLFIFFTDFGTAVLARSAGLNGQRRMADDPAAPSRSYLKLEEAYGILGREPAPGETAVDLGAAPGGWSYSAARRGAHVLAVDNGPLKGGALDHPRIEHLREDAFRFAPGGRRFDWLLCDLVEEPHHVLTGIVRPWLANRWCRRLVVNLKFGRVDPIALLHELRSPDSPFAPVPDLRVRHLFHDREEFTVTGTCPVP